MTKFIVTDGDGDATFKLYVDGKKKDTITVTVEEGITYKIHVYVGTGSCFGQGKDYLKIKTSSSDNDATLQARCSPVTANSMNFYED